MSRADAGFSYASDSAQKFFLEGLFRRSVRRDNKCSIRQMFAHFVVLETNEMLCELKRNIEYVVYVSVLCHLIMFQFCLVAGPKLESSNWSLFRYAALPDSMRQLLSGNWQGLQRLAGPH